LNIFYKALENVEFPVLFFYSNLKKGH